MALQGRIPDWIVRNWIPLVLGLALAVVVAFLVATSCAGENSDNDAATPTGTITATGRLAFIANDGNLTLINPDGSGAQPVTQNGGVQRFEWSADGSLIALERRADTGTDVQVIGPDGGQVFQAAGAAAPAWAPAGGRLLVERDGGLEVLDAAGSPVRAFPSAVMPDWSADGEGLAFIRTSGNGNGVPMTANIATGEERPLDAALAPEQAIYPVLWQPGGTALAYRNGLYDPATGAKTELTGITAAFSPDGRLLMVIQGADPTVIGRPAQLLDLSQEGLPPIIGVEVRPAPDGTPPWLFVRKWMDWGLDGRIFFYMDQDQSRPRVRVFDTVGLTQDPYSNIAGEHPELSPDSTHAAFQFESKVWVFPLNATALAPIAEGSLPAWQPRN